MFSTTVWKETYPAVPLDNGTGFVQHNSVFDACFSPDLSTTLVAAGRRVLVYNTFTGELKKTLKSHKEQVFSVCYNYDGSSFVSGGKDKLVIIWTKEGKGLLKYSHAAAVQAVRFSPVKQKLVSCGVSEFGLCSPDIKKVERVKVKSRILCCEWTLDGSVFAFGHENGEVVIRDGETGEEYRTICRQAPVWGLTFLYCNLDEPINEDNVKLAIGSWDERLSFYNLEGQMIGRERKLESFPCSLSHLIYKNSCYFLVGGSDRKVTLYSKDGIKIGTCGAYDSWVFCCKGGFSRSIGRSFKQHLSPGTSVYEKVSRLSAVGPIIFCGSRQGVAQLDVLSFSNATAFHKDRYAFTDSMTDVVVINIATLKKVGIKTGEYVYGIALYKTKLAILHEKKVTLYQVNVKNDGNSLLYTYQQRLSLIEPSKNPKEVQFEQMFGLHSGIGALATKHATESKLKQGRLLVGLNHVVLVAETYLDVYSFESLSSRNKKRQLFFYEHILYAQLLAGKPSNEGVLVALQNGSFYLVYIETAFKSELLTVGRKQAAELAQVETSLLRNYLAIVCGQSCCVYSLSERAKVYEKKNAVSICFNSFYNDFLFVRNLDHSGTLVLLNYNKTSSASTGAKQSVITSKVVGVFTERLLRFDRNMVFSVDDKNHIQRKDVSLQQLFIELLHRHDIQKALDVARLGVPPSEWRKLGITALHTLDFSTAREAFGRLKDRRYLRLVHTLQRKQRALRIHTSEERQRFKNLALAEILLLQDQYELAAECFLKADLMESAMDIFKSLHKYSEAKRFLQKASQGASSKAQKEAKSSETGIVFDSNLELQGLVRSEAASALEQKQYKKAMTLYREIGEVEKAIEIGGEQGLVTELVSLMRQLPASETVLLRSVAQYLLALKELQFVKECLLKIGDAEGLIKVYLTRNEFEEAFLLSKQNNHLFDAEVNYQYGIHLALKDEFEAAQEAFTKAERTEESKELLKSLLRSSIDEERFLDASYFLFLLSQDMVRIDPDNGSENTLSTSFQEYTCTRFLAEQFFAYKHVHDYINKPFYIETYGHDTLYNASRYLLNQWNLGSLEMNPALNQLRGGMSKSAVLMTLIKQCRELGANRLGCQLCAYTKHYRFSKERLDVLDTELLGFITEGGDNDPELQIVCYRCSAENSPVRLSEKRGTGLGDRCQSCFHPYIRSFCSFDILPLVQFAPPHDLSAEAVMEAIRQETGDETDVASATQLTASGSCSSQSFEEHLYSFNFSHSQEAGSYVPLAVTTDMLEHMTEEEVFLVSSSCQDDTGRFNIKYYKNVVPEIGIHKCDRCQLFFNAEEYEEMLFERKGSCPFCKYHS